MTQDLKAEIQDWLDRWANCFVANDPDTFDTLAQRPFSVRSHGSEWIVTTREEMDAGFEVYRKLLEEHRVDLVVRVVRQTERLSETEVKVLYENYLMSGTQRVFRPSGAEAYLRRVGDDWKAYRVIEVEFGTDDQDLPQTRADRLHDQAVRDHLMKLRPSTEETEND